MKKLLFEFGMSTITVPLLNANQKDFEKLQRRKNRKKTFKELIELEFNSEKSEIKVSCIRKEQIVLNEFLGNSNYP